MSLHARPVLDLADAGITGEVIDWSVTHDGAILVLAADSLPRWRAPGEESWFATTSPSPIGYTAHVIEHDDVTSVRIPPTNENLARLRRLNPHELLLVRSRLGKDDPPDGAVIGLDGVERRRVMIGDAIEHLFVAPDASLWIGFFDEGSCRPLSRGGGIVRIDAQGNTLLAVEAPGLDLMDVYAMTMNADGSVVACAYTDFEFIRVSLGGRIARLGTSPIRGSQTLAVHADVALVDAGYDAHDQLALVNLRTLDVQSVAISAMGLDAPPPWRFAISGVLYLFSGTELFAVDVPRHFPAAAPGMSQRRT